MNLTANKNKPARAIAMVVRTFLRPALYFSLAAVMSACSQQISEQELLGRAQAAFAEGDLKSAVIDVKTALQQNADNTQARRLLGEIYAFQQDPIAAADEFERALRHSNDDELRVLYARALVTASRGELLLGLHDADNFVSVERNPQYLTALALAQIAAGQPVLARELLDEALLTGADDPYVATAYAFYLLLHGGGPEEAQATLMDTLAQHPGHVEAWSLLGDIQQMRTEFANAEASYTKAVKLNPYRLADRLNLIVMRIEQGELDAARSELQPLLTNNPNHPGVNFVQGRMLMASGDDAAALEAFYKVLSDVPNHPGSLYLAAVANRREGNLSTALNQLNSYLVIRPKDLSGRLQLANLHLLLDNPQEAEDIARTILAQHPEHQAAMGLLAASLSARGAHQESIALYQRIVALQPDSTAARLALGSALQRAGDSTASIAQFRDARDRDPQSNAAWEHLIQMLVISGDLADAGKEAEAYATAFPTSARPNLFLGGVALQKQDLSAAHSYLERALALDPGNVAANRALAALAGDDLEQARKRYMDALAHHPDDATSLLNLAAIEGARGDFRAMESNLNTAVKADSNALSPRLSLARLKLEQGRAADAVTLLNDIRDHHRSEPGVWLLLTEALLAVGDVAAASEAAENLLDLLPNDEVALATVARVELRNGRFADAEAHLRKALEKQADNIPLHKLLADALMGQGKLEETSALLAALPPEEANEPTTQVALGRIALASNQPAEAEAYLRKAMSANPNAMTLLWLGGAITAQGRSSEALGLLATWLADNPDDVLVRNQLAASYLQSGRELEARGQYQEILQKMPDNVLILNNLAWLFRTDDPQRALAYIEKANRLAPDNAQVKDTYAMIQLERNAIREALALNQKALELTPDNPQLLYHRTMILRADGQNEEVIRILEKLVTQPDFAQMEEARSLLVQLRGS
ncbi:MAG: XrtA/PEP-CTERM system TPR-repeat protein PrsT [Porticoccaceae bacterium]